MTRFAELLALLLLIAFIVDILEFWQSAVGILIIMAIVVWAQLRARSDN